MNERLRFSVPDEVGLEPSMSAVRGGIEFNPRDSLNQLWRNRRLLVGTVFMLTALAVLIAFQIAPRYRSELTLQIIPPKEKVVGIESLLEGTPFSQETLNTEIGIIKSRRLAGRVIKRLRLDLDPEFNPALESSSAIFSWVSSLFGVGGEDKLSLIDRRIRELAQVEMALQKVLGVRIVRRSRLLTISVTSLDAKKAAKIANVVSELYLVFKLDAKFETTKRETKWLSGRISSLRAAVERSERAVEAYRSKHGLVKGKGDTTIVTTQIAQVSSQLILARAKRAEVAARLEQMEKLLKSKRGIESAAEVLSSGLIQRLRERESEVIGKMAELAAVFGRKHPKMLAVRAEMADLRRKIRVEVRKIVRQVRNEAEVTRVREASVEKSLADLERKSSRLNEKSVGLRVLEREAKSNRTLLETVLARFKEATAQKSIQSADARIVSFASVPPLPYFPRKKLIIVLAFVSAMLIGIGLVFLKEYLDSVFRSSAQVEALTGISVFGLLPEIARSSIDPTQLADYIDNNPLSKFVESLRGLRLSIFMSNVDNPPKSILITSASPDEGKTVLAFALARVIAGTPKKTVLLDCDFRRPSLHKYLEAKSAPGIIELIAGEAKLSDVLRRDEVSGMHFIPAGKPVANPGNLLASEQMKLLLKALTDTYEMVIVDSPPMLAVNDARALGPVVDATLFVVRWGKIRRKKATFAVRHLVDSGTKVSGIALSRVHLKKFAAYDDYDSGLYHEKYAKYYST